MEVTEVRVALRVGEQRLKAYATVTFDHCFVVRNIKIIEGRNGLFVAMPSHKTKAACARCAFKNDVGSRFCVQCGSRLSAAAEVRVEAGAPDLEKGESAAHHDIAHPITVEFRQYLQNRILQAYSAEREKQPPVAEAAASKAA